LPYRKRGYIVKKLFDTIKSIPYEYNVIVFGLILTAVIIITAR